MRAYAKYKRVSILLASSPLVGAIRRRLFPEQLKPRSGRRTWSLVFRTLHLAAFGLLLGGHAFGVEAGRLLPSLWLTILSGLGLIALEVEKVGLYWFTLGKGVLVLVKLAVLLLVPLFWEARVLLLLLVVGIASIGSHMPARYRHYSLLHRRTIEPGETFTRRGIPLLPKVKDLATVDEKRPKR